MLRYTTSINLRILATLRILGHAPRIHLQGAPRRRIRREIRFPVEVIPYSFLVGPETADTGRDGIIHSIHACLLTLSEFKFPTAAAEIQVYRTDRAQRQSQSPSSNRSKRRVKLDVRQTSSVDKKMPFTAANFRTRFLNTSYAHPEWYSLLGVF